MSKKIATVIIPTYNEADTIENLIRCLFDRVIKNIKDWQVMVLIVDGNSPDKTSIIVKALIEEYSNLDLLIEKKKEGIGAAYIKGFKYAVEKYKTDVLIEFDGDFQHPPEIIPLLLKEIDNGYDYILGSRRIKGGAYPVKWGFKRNFLSRFGGYIARLLLFFPFKEFFLVTDPTTGLKATKVKKLYELIDLNDLSEKGFGYKLELIYMMVTRGAKVKEIPLDFNIRLAGESKITAQTPLEIFRTVFYLRFHDKKTLRFLKFCVVGFLGFIINAFFLEVFIKTNFLDNLVKNFYFLRNIPFLNLLSTKSSWAAGLSTELAILSNFIFNNLWTFSTIKIKGVIELLYKFFVFNLTSIGAVIILFCFIGFSSILINDSFFVRQMTLVLSIIFVIIPYNWFIYNKIIWKKNRK